MATAPAALTASTVRTGDTVTVTLTVSYTRLTLTGGVQVTDDITGVTVLLPADHPLGLPTN